MDTQEVFHHCELSDTYKTVRIIIATLIAVAAIFGNALIIASILKFKTLRTTFYLLIGNLALADFITGFVLLTYPIESVFTGLSDIKYFCLTRLSVISAVVACSGSTLVLISFVRFIAVMFPLKRLKYEKCLNVTIYVLIICAWMVISCVGFIPVMGVNNYDKGFNVSCENGDIVPKELSILTAGCVLLFLVVNCGMYILMMYRLFSQSLQKGKQYGRTRLMALVFGIFGIFWLPYVLLTLASANNFEIYCIIEYTTLLGFLNSAINWIIYGLFNAKFKQAFMSFSCKAPSGTRVPVSRCLESEFSTSSHKSCFTEF